MSLNYKMIIVLASHLCINNIKYLLCVIYVCVCVLEKEIAETDLHEPVWPSLSLPFSSVCHLFYLFPPSGPGDV